MVKIAILGYGTIGSGVYKVLDMNREAITRRVGQRVRVKYVLDLREFPGDPAQEILTHDFNDIVNDPEVQIVVETMGGLKPAYNFTKQCLLAGKSVVSSNKELVAEYGVELRDIARDMNVNYMFEASCGGGIPIIRAINTALTAEEIMELTGILNGTTNYILTSMAEEQKEFDTALKEAQAKGYAELHPEADIEGWDACRKIAILSSLAYGKHLSYKDIQTEGITNIDKTDMAYAALLGVKIKLIATSQRNDKGTWAMVAPMMVGKENPIETIDGVMNAVLVRGNALGDAMFSGSGAGSLPTASAVVADVIDCAKHLNGTIRTDYSAAPLSLIPADEVERPFFARTTSSEEEVRAVFGDVRFASVEGLDEERGFLTSIMPEKEFKEKAKKISLIKFIRRGRPRDMA